MSSPDLVDEIVRTPVEARLGNRRRILLVESERDQSLYWDAIFRSLGFEVLIAGSLREAAALAASGLSIIASSSLLCDGTGVGFFAQLRARPEMALVYLVLLTSSGAEVIASLHAGANDCIDMSAAYGEIRARLELAERVISLNEALHHKSAALSEALAVIQNELQSAAALQAAMLPQPLHHGTLSIRCLYRPSDVLGGDMIGVVPAFEDRIAFGLIDVVGHGTASALISCSLIREMMDRMAVLVRDPDPAVALHSGRTVIQELNRRYCALNLPGMYFTALAGVLDARDGKVTYCQAGHPNLVDFDPEFGWRELPDSGYPIGLLDGADYTSRELAFEPGQMLLAVSDGMLRPHAGDPGGSLALLQTLRDAGSAPDAVVGELDQHAARAPDEDRDDQSALLISRAATRAT
ncbi:MAG: SpoIIE family protein phosphatase [Steroidobacteraceae bacterium]